MSGFSQCIADLSPQKRVLLALRLMKKGASVADAQAIPLKVASDVLPTHTGAREVKPFVCAVD